MRVAKLVARAVAVDTAVALIVPVLELAINPRFSFAYLLREFAYSCVYSNVIGGLAHWLIPKLWPVCAARTQPASWALRVLLLLALAVAGCLLAGLVFVALGWMRWEHFWPQFAGSVKIAALITLGVGGVIGGYESLRYRLDETTLALRTKELERERALKLATEAQLASLESRIHPHFLFNTLNSISALIPQDPKAAERLVERMAALLRFSLDARNAGLVTLEHEMRIVADYLEIEKTRFGGRLRYELDIPGELLNTQVPPLAVQTLVENSVKYAVAPSRGGGDIRVQARGEGAAMMLEITDSGPGFDLANAPAGHGIDNLRGRLAALFGRAGTLSARRESGTSAVLLSIPRTANGHASLPGR